MPLPKEGSPESHALDYRVIGIISSTYDTVAATRELPATVQVLIHEETSNERFGSFVDLVPEGRDKKLVKRMSGPAVLRQGVSLEAIADSLLTRNPGVPLVCNRTILDGLPEGLVTTVEDGHYRIERGTGGNLDLFTPKLPTRPRG